MSINTTTGENGKKQSVILQYFAFEHLPEHLQEVSQDFYCLARYLDSTLPSGPEKSAGLRKLLEAKDCMVRAAIHTE